MPVSSSGPPLLEPGRWLVGFRHRRDVVDPGRPGPMMAAAQHLVDCLGRAEERGLDRAVAAVADPAPQASLSA